MRRRKSRRERAVRPGGAITEASVNVSVEEIEEVLREMASEAPPPVDEPFAARRERVCVDAIPEDVPLAESGIERERDVDARPTLARADVLAALDDAEEDGGGHVGIDIATEREIMEASAGALRSAASEIRTLAVAEPMTSHDAQVISYGENVRQVSLLIESVSRTLEAQNQRSLRLMERLDHVARVLETLPEEADRNLEALDSVSESVKAQHAPLKSIDERLSNLPRVLEAVEESNRVSRELFSQTTRAMAGRMAAQSAEREARTRQDRTHRRWRTLSAVAVAFAMGFLTIATETGSRVRVVLGEALVGAPRAASADEMTPEQKREKRRQEEAARALREREESSLGTDEELEGE